MVLSCSEDGGSRDGGQWTAEASAPAGGLSEVGQAGKDPPQHQEAPPHAHAVTASLVLVLPLTNGSTGDRGYRLQRPLASVRRQVAIDTGCRSAL